MIAREGNTSRRSVLRLDRRESTSAESWFAVPKAGTASRRNQISRRAGDHRLLRILSWLLAQLADVQIHKMGRSRSSGSCLPLDRIR